MPVRIFKAIWRTGESHPGDLFTGYIRLGDTVLVNGGAFPITDGMFMPETRSQDTESPL